METGSNLDALAKYASYEVERNRLKRRKSPESESRRKHSRKESIQIDEERIRPRITTSLINGPRTPPGTPPSDIGQDGNTPPDSPDPMDSSHSWTGVWKSSPSLSDKEKVSYTSHHSMDINQEHRLSSERKSSPSSLGDSLDPSKSCNTVLDECGKSSSSGQHSDHYSSTGLQHNMSNYSLDVDEISAEKHFKKRYFSKSKQWNQHSSSSSSCSSSKSKRSHKHWESDPSISLSSKNDPDNYKSQSFEIVNRGNLTGGKVILNRLLTQDNDPVYRISDSHLLEQRNSSSIHSKHHSKSLTVGTELSQGEGISTAGSSKSSSKYAFISTT